jgi:hypothetical protein
VWRTSPDLVSSICWRVPIHWSELFLLYKSLQLDTLLFCDTSLTIHVQCSPLNCRRSLWETAVPSNFTSDNSTVINKLTSSVEQCPWETNSRSVSQEISLFYVTESCHLGGVMGSVLAIGPEVLGFKPGRGDVFLRAISIRSTPSFGAEVQPSTDVVRVYGMEKSKILRRLNSSFPSPCSS